jgi:hypothetical protein
VEEAQDVVDRTAGVQQEQERDGGRDRGTIVGRKKAVR